MTSMNMGRTLRYSLIASALLLGGCETFDLDKLNPFGDQKTPLPGERKAVFPEGVPGVTQGVPQDLLKTNQPQATAPAEEAVPPPEPAKKPQRRTSNTRPPQQAPQSQ